MALRTLFIGGYTKSGTTYLGRAFDTIEHVYTRGEMDYFRLLFQPIGRAFRDYNRNLDYVNREVYDGQGELEAVPAQYLCSLHRSLFTSLFFNGESVPEDARVLVEKSPRNVFHMAQIKIVFPRAEFVTIFREPLAVASSLIRHMTDHRGEEYGDPEHPARIELLDSFVEDRWPLYVSILNKRRAEMTLISYESAARDPGQLVDFIQSEILKAPDWQRRSPPETLTKEAYLKGLPEAARAKSLVQTVKSNRLSDSEISRIQAHCQVPDLDFDF